MRAILTVTALFLIAALVWALHAPLASYGAASRIATPDADAQALSRELRRAGSGATLALRWGVAQDAPRRRAYCARLLALAGDRNGDRVLLLLLREHGGAELDTVGALAETFLLSVWAQRGGPPDAVRERALRSDADPAVGMAGLSSLLEKYPAWSAGYAQRARLSLRRGDALDARRCALLALAVEPANFEAMVALGQANLMLDSPTQALTCLDQAVRVNPRLKHSLQKEVHDILKALDRERARRRLERRKEMPAV
ncbi:MAG: hypothetical protein NTW87_00010 [Planctomycetota bacterium]|nr:hypothetical protein [Planctomycetota bacterium]